MNQNESLNDGSGYEPLGIAKLFSSPYIKNIINWFCCHHGNQIGLITKTFDIRHGFENQSCFCRVGAHLNIVSLLPSPLLSHSIDSMNQA